MIGEPWATTWMSTFDKKKPNTMKILSDWFANLTGFFDLR